MNHVVLIRHGATEGNLQHRYIGRTDEPLCELGISQAEQLRKCKWKIDYLFSSPALRTRQTAKIAFPGLKAEIIDDLIEMDFGAFEGKSADELSENADYRAWVESNCLDQIPEGEHTADFKARCCAAFSTAAEQLPDGSCAAFVIHGGSIMAILEAFSDSEKSFYEYHISNGQYVECTYEDRVLRVTGGALY